MAVAVQQTHAPDEQPPRPRAFDKTIVTEMGAFVIFYGQVLRALPGSVKYTSEALRQTALLIVGTSPLLFVMYVFMGIVTMNTGYFLLHPLGAVDYLGAIGAFGIHVSGVMMFVWVFVSKVCGGFVAELGAMKINQEIDAYESTGVDPLRYVVGTRMLAVLIYLPIATVVGLLGYALGCYLDAIVILAATDSAGFWRFNWLSQGIRDQLFVFTTVALSGLITAAAACFYGLRATGGPAGVGDAVAQAVKVNLVIANLVMFFTVVLWYGKDAGVPIGG